MPAAHRALNLHLNGGPLEVTEDTEVFVVSPHTKLEQRKQRKKDRARAGGQPGELAALGLPTTASAPGTPMGKDREAGFADVGDDAGSSGGGSERDGGAQNGGEETEDSSEESEEYMGDPLEDGIKRRAGEQMMVQNLKLLAAKMRQYPGRRATTGSGRASGPGPPPAAEPVECTRKEARDLAVEFTMVYSRTVGILQENMTLAPPNRRHSVSFGDLRAYASTAGSSTGGPWIEEGRRAALEQEVSSSGTLAAAEALPQAQEVPVRRRSMRRVLSGASEDEEPSSSGGAVRRRSMRHVLSGASEEELSSSGPLEGMKLPFKRSRLLSSCQASAVSEEESVDLESEAEASHSAEGESVLDTVLGALCGFESYSEGRLDWEDFAFVLQALDPTTFREAALEMLRGALGVDAEGRLELLKALEWIFADV